ncbi:IS256 family transposase [Streptomyces sp. NPDC058572]|uniref:IS256 family transposase n=1 Tax=Streptomyces sp. NPDC058572 TaxID=3346546 RepID=UPI0036525448
MSETTTEGSAVEKPAVASSAESVSDERLIALLVERARSDGLRLTGEGGLLQQLTKRVLESAPEGGTTDHDGRHGTRSRTVLTDGGPVEVKVPGGTVDTVEPQIVSKRQRRLTGVDEMVLSLCAKGLAHGEISAHLAEVYGANVSEQTVTTITDRVMEGMAEWQSRPLDRVYPVVFVDAVDVKVRDGRVANRPIHIAMAVTVEGTRDILGIWAGDGGEGGEHWLQVFTELRNRGVEDVLVLVCDGLKGLPDAVEAVWPRTVVQTCIVHLIRNSVRYVARQDRGKVADDLIRPVCTAPSETAAAERFLEFSEKWGAKCPAVIKLWSDAWAEMVPFLSFDVEIRKVICSTNAIENVNAHIRKAVRARGHFPSENAALKCVYMALMSLDPTGRGRRRWTTRWKAPLNAFQIAFEGRLTPAGH